MKPVLTFQPYLSMSISKRIILFFTISVVTASCDYKTDIPDYAHPEDTDASAEVGDTTSFLQATFLIGPVSKSVDSILVRIRIV